MNEIGGTTDHTSEHIIKKIGVYSSRYDELRVIEISDIFDRSTLSEIKDWLTKQAKVK